ncbi:glucosylglycerate hydrolase [Actinorugispora endophytica]|uniref:Mannosylglycerate hydrolase MGH1-like glycoside hydrolase domain-containing protein n=1 Tax=Actinorugispora endophytica TaxID=1605990 RepID=A0A4R6UW97_9ACTN|nr:glycogen debranching protein [Actinorugispora endophytica]TDQ50259.1 hypothetical protein EV190_11328 [Actinorugispora endophytica]
MTTGPVGLFAPQPQRPRLGAVALASGAAWVLAGNDTGSMVTASPRLYPHMWSWDAAFIMVGLAQLDVHRAAREMETLLGGQWADGMIPHIVFSDETGYFPGPERWETALLGEHAPAAPHTSGICQPPVHAVALRKIVDAGRRRSGADQRRAEALLEWAWPRLFAWQRWLATRRDPLGTGLIAVTHGWESGMDNSPRWDSAYAAVRPGPDLPPYTRKDLDEVGDEGERPSDAEYDRYLWLIEEMRRAGYRSDEIVRSGSFLVGDVFMSAVFALSCDVLAELGEESGRSGEQVALLRDWAARSRAAVAATRDPVTGLARDFDVRAGEWIATPSVAGFSPLLCGGLEPDARAALVATLEGPDWTGHPDLATGSLPTVSPSSPGFLPKQYWRGPQWPVISWLFSWAMRRGGMDDTAAGIRAETLRLVSDGTFAEYYHPLTGAPLGSLSQSWTAAVVLDWLYEG